MNLLETIMAAGGGQAVGKLAETFGIAPSLAQAVVGQLVPNLAQGMQNNTKQPGGLEALTRALGQGNHQRYVDDPDVLTKSETIDDGNNILGHILGSKDVSRKVAGHASQRTGVDTDIIKKMLPMVAAMAMGALSKSQAPVTQEQRQAQPRAQEQAQEEDSGGIGGLLANMLDANNDGSVADDLLGMAGKFFSR